MSDSAECNGGGTPPPHVGMEQQGNGIKDASEPMDAGELIKSIMEVIDVVCSYEDYRKTQRKECLGVVRRMKLLVPFLDELMEMGSDSIPEEVTCRLEKLKSALVLAKKLLRCCHDGSKIYLVRTCVRACCFNFHQSIYFRDFCMYLFYVWFYDDECRPWKGRQCSKDLILFTKK